MPPRPDSDRAASGVSRDAQDFLDRGYARDRFGDAVVIHRAHAFFDTGTMNVMRRCVRQNEAPDLVGERQKFEHADASAIAAAAMLAAARAIKCRRVGRVRQMKLTYQFGQRLIGLAAMDAELAH